MTSSLRRSEPPLTTEYAAAHLGAPARMPSGGDFYDAFPLPSGDAIAVVIGDVAGHSPQQTAQAEQMREWLDAALRAGLSPADTLTEVNARMDADPRWALHGTVFVGILEAGTGRLRYACGGHEPALIAAPDAGTTGQATPLPATGPPVGAFTPDTARFEQREAVVPAGGTLLLYTDGITDAFAPQDRTDRFGLERLQRLLARFAALPPRGLVSALLWHVSRFSRGRFEDDLTLLAIRRRFAAPPD